MAVHSTQLGHLVGAGTGSFTIYTVPAGKRTIVKSIWMRNNTAAAITGAWAIALIGGGTVNFFQSLAASPAAGSTVQIDTWVVLNAGDQLKISGTAGSGVDAIASGAELTV